MYYKEIEYLTDLLSSTIQAFTIFHIHTSNFSIYDLNVVLCFSSEGKICWIVCFVNKTLFSKINTNEHRVSRNLISFSKRSELWTTQLFKKRVKMELKYSKLL